MFQKCTLHLPDSGYMADDTKKIREATRLFFGSWVFPLLDAIESGDTQALKWLTETEHGITIEDRIKLAESEAPTKPNAETLEEL